MSLHPSLHGGKSKKHKSVLSRLERLIRLQREDRWKEEDSIFGLPKVKVTRLKIKKEKPKAEEEAEVAAVAGAEGAEAKVEADTSEDTAKKSEKKSDEKR